jgi:hypothetical protein
MLLADHGLERDSVVWVVQKGISLFISLSHSFSMALSYSPFNLNLPRPFLRPLFRFLSSLCSIPCLDFAI